MSDIRQTDLIAENARLLDRLTKQQEINQSLRVENAQLKENYKAVLDTLYNTEDTDHDLLGDCGDICEEIDKLKEENAQLEARIEKLREELLQANAKHYHDIQKTSLAASFDTWREIQGKNGGYSIEDEAEWLIDEATNIQDAVDIFNELYEDGMCGDESTYQLECDHEKKWELNQWWLDDEGNYTLTEEEFERNNADEEEKKSCDFCDKERKVLTKRDAGYEEWTCSTCHKEQYPEEYEEKQ